MRLFIAIPLPHQIQQALDAWWHDERRLLPGWRSIPEINRHLTLHFLGDIHGNKLDDLAESLEANFAITASMQLAINGMGFFPSPSRARTFWVGVDDLDMALARAARQCRRLCQQVQDKHGKATPFRAHITMARHAEKFTIPNLEQFSAPPYLCWNANEVHLIQSRLRPEGASYRVLERITLDG
ncbi:RNA 2',3'-cyclic phosphodiesterase [Mariprofundus sp. EBB-1]|uniref:RNA 2',3'-cyclic phosphodiesterase n=1 Tax=Mariprofundus sp. EBB-1 TaxID=2650971 RepID=UPI000EF210B8|nr:RNA 2',3'-cyclic phosphodiesterase [Mariprofundus sp. EBB-1]RLL51065.1 RNA 2',3'-cyclic phosphodiesterase [Mariprofundus sp. EBB-1]